MDLLSTPSSSLLTAGGVRKTLVTQPPSAVTPASGVSVHNAPMPGISNKVSIRNFQETEADKVAMTIYMKDDISAEDLGCLKALLEPKQKAEQKLSNIHLGKVLNILVSLYRSGSSHNLKPLILACFANIRKRDDLSICTAAIYVFHVGELVGHSDAEVSKAATGLILDNILTNYAEIFLKNGCGPDGVVVTLVLPAIVRARERHLLTKASTLVEWHPADDFPQQVLTSIERAPGLLGECSDEGIVRAARYSVQHLRRLCCGMRLQPEQNNAIEDNVRIWAGLCSRMLNAALARKFSSGVTPVLHTSNQEHDDPALKIASVWYDFQAWLQKQDGRLQDELRIIPPVRPVPDHLSSKVDGRMWSGVVDEGAGGVMQAAPADLTASGPVSGGGDYLRPLITLLDACEEGAVLDVKDDRVRINEIIKHGNELVVFMEKAGFQQGAWPGSAERALERLQATLGSVDLFRLDHALKRQYDIYGSILFGVVDRAS